MAVLRPAGLLDLQRIVNSGILSDISIENFNVHSLSDLILKIFYCLAKYCTLLSKHEMILCVQNQYYC